MLKTLFGSKKLTKMRGFWLLTQFFKARIMEKKSET